MEVCRLERVELVFFWSRGNLEATLRSSTVVLFAVKAVRRNLYTYLHSRLFCFFFSAASTRGFRQWKKGKKDKTDTMTVLEKDQRICFFLFAANTIIAYSASIKAAGFWRV